MTGTGRTEVLALPAQPCVEEPVAAQFARQPLATPAAGTPETLVESLFLRFYSRAPAATERMPLAQALSAGFAARVLPASKMKPPVPLPPLPTVSWSNHLVADANAIAIEMEKRARLGPPPDPRLNPEWRERFEDVVWSLVNSREFVWLP
jgi:hypothetical protein